MTPGVISFSCSSCGVQLTVPEAMAGVSGPCPRCSATIQAPAPAAAPAAEAPAAAPTPSPAPAPTPKKEIPAARSADTPPTSITPEPRAMPERQGAKGITARKSTRDASLRRRQTAPSSGRAPSSRGPGLSRIFLPLAFIIAGGTTVYVLCYFFLPGGPGESLRTNSTPPPGSPPIENPIYPETKTETPSDQSSESTSPASNAAVGDAPPISADGSDAIAAETVLDRFLVARSLEERLPMIDPPLPADQLQGTILARILPEVLSVSPETPSFDSIEDLSNFPFRVSFQGGEGSVVEYTILVRKRAELEPQVVVNPFLDLVGGRLAQFAATPTDGTHTFHAVIEAMPRCFEENIPNPDKKFTYKLSSCNVGRATARAYASLNSSLAEQLWTPDSRIRWGKRIRATVTLQWNTTEDPKQPYIELIEIKGLDWNS
ncbi:hypothetical protein [Haloferula sp.]|uniref:hypothetical protein n=1 Tax=Haloferula sp. TaxID=2497595 RepID=UPI0032A10F59